jgi:RNA polymerase primary sigma factor
MIYAPPRPAPASSSRLSAAQERALALRSEAGDREARRRLVEGHLGLVVWLARHFTGRGVPFEDLVQEGTLGLLTAVDRFDHRQARLSTYAGWWIRRALRAAAHDQGHPVRLTDRAGGSVEQIAAARARLHARSGREPRAGEIADALGLARRQVEHLEAISHPARSLESSAPEADGTLGDLLPDPHSPDPEQVVAEQERRREVRRAVAALPRREQRTVILRFGLADGEPRSRPEVGIRLGVGRERARQLEVRALERLRERVAGMLDDAA